MSEANEIRGEASMMIDGVEALLRPSMEAIRKAEVASGTGLLHLCQLAGSGQMDSLMAAKVITPLLRAGAREGDTGMRNAGVDRIAELILEAPGGLMIALKKLEIVLMMAATGGYTATGEVKATAAQTKN